MQRLYYLKKIQLQFRVHPICALLGARQVGKTTLAHMYVEQHFLNDAHFFDLENPLDVARLENPMLALTSIEQTLIVIDEIQRRPELFPILRVLVDDKNFKHKFLILGSASRELIQQSSETLAGRIGYIELPPLSLTEVHDSQKLWLRGGFPLSYLAETEQISLLWRQSYITTFLERDIPNLGFNVPAPQMRRFWLMLAHYHGQVFNASELGKSLGVSDHTVRKYLDILAGTFMIRILPAWFENLHKRQIKSPKIYFRDSGILHALTGVNDMMALQTNPKLGAYWEGFALEEVIQVMEAHSYDCYFWSTQSTAELDLLIIKDDKRFGFEFKYTDSPKITRSMHTSLIDLKLHMLILVYPGKQIFPMDKNIYAFGLETISNGDFIKHISI